MASLATRLKANWIAGGIVLAVPAMAAASEGEEPSLFAGDLGNILCTLIIFFLLLFILKRYAWGPMLEALRRREQFIEETIENARKQKAEADALLAKYQEQLDKSQQEARAIIEQARRDAEQVRQRLQAEARTEAEQMIERARQEIALARDAALRELQDVAADLAVGAASKILRREVSGDDHRRLIEQSLAELTGSNGGGTEA